MSKVVIFLFFAYCSLLLYNTNLNAQSPVTEKQNFDQSLKYFATKEYASALTILQQLAKYNPHNNLYRFNLANAYYMLQNYSMAAQEYKAVSVKSQLYPIAKFYESKCYRQLQELPKAAKILSVLNERNLPKTISAEIKRDYLNLYLDWSLAEYQKEQYTNAIRLAEKSLEIEPTAEAFLLKGMILLKLEKYETAKTFFEKAKSLDDGALIAQNADEFISQIADELSAKKTKNNWLNLTTGAGNNSNYYGDSSDETILSRNFAGCAIDAGLNITQIGDFSIALSNYVSWNEILTIPEDRLLADYIGLFFKFYNNNWDIKFEPSYGFLLLAQDNYLLKPGASLGIARTWGDFFEIGLSYTHVNYKPWNDYYLNQEGYYDGKKLGVRFFQRKYYIGLNYLIFDESLPDLVLTTGTLPQGYGATGLQAYAFWLITKKLNFDIGMSIIQKTFSQNTTTPTDTRKDMQKSATIKVSYYLLEELQIFASADYVLNASTFDSTAADNKNYQQLILYSGLTWDIF